MTAGNRKGLLSLRLEQIAALLNAELTEHPVYDGFELQWFDDDRHGTGMLAFLSRREDRRVDYYAQRGLRIDRSGYQIGGGTRSWSEVDFDTARLHVADDGVDAEVRFRDIDGREVHVRVDDRDGRARSRGGLLAPVGAAVEKPSSLLLVWMPVFDLVRRTGTRPLIRIGDADAQIGRLPGARLHGRHLIKYAAPVLALQVNPQDAGEVTTPEQSADQDTGLLNSVTTHEGEHEARLVLAPGLPSTSALQAASADGRWHVEIDGVRLTGGTWSGAGTSSGARVSLEVDERWSPGRMPWLMRLVTTVVPVFRRWPTTYRWESDVRLGEEPAVVSRWERTGSSTDDSYRRSMQPARRRRARRE